MVALLGEALDEDARGVSPVIQGPQERLHENRSAADVGRVGPPGHSHGADMPNVPGEGGEVLGVVGVDDVPSHAGRVEQGVDRCRPAALGYAAEAKRAGEAVEVHPGDPLILLAGTGDLVVELLIGEAGQALPARGLLIGNAESL